jgi:ATP synthase protein I
MNQKTNNRGQKEMKGAVDLRRSRLDRWQREGERSIWQNLSMIGALGWLIVTPTLIGVVSGRWLDNTFDMGIFFTGTLIFAGATVGSYLAWRRVHTE